MDNAPKQQELKRLLDAGFTCYRAAKAMGISHQAAYALLGKLRKRGYVYPPEVKV